MFTVAREASAGSGSETPQRTALEGAHSLTAGGYRRLGERAFGELSSAAGTCLRGLEAASSSRSGQILSFSTPDGYWENRRTVGLLIARCWLAQCPAETASRGAWRPDLLPRPPK